MTVSFSEISTDILEPGFYGEIAANTRNIGILAYPSKALIIGQKLAAGTLTPLTMRQVTRWEEAIALFGQGSQAVEAVKAFFQSNTSQALFVMAINEAGGAVKATGTFTFAGAIPAQATVLYFRVGGRQVRITVVATDTLTTIAAALAAAINADLDMLVTATSAVGVVTVTARQGGEFSNEIDLRVDTAAQVLPSGLTCTIVGMSGGAGNPVLQTALDAVANAWITDVSHPFTDATNMAAFSAWLIARYKAGSRLDVHGYLFKRGSFSALTTWGNSVNCAQLSCIGLKAAQSSPWVIAAAIMGVAVFNLTNDPSRQLRSLPLVGVIGADPADLFIDSEQDLLLRNGVSTLDQTSDGTLTISRLITTYKTNALGIADRSWLDIMVPKTMSRIRYDWSGYLALLYPRAKLMPDNSTATFGYNPDLNDTSVVTPRLMRGSWAARCKLYEQDRAWLQETPRTVKESVFEINSSDRNRLDTRLQMRIVGNLIVNANRLEFQP